MTFNGQLTNIGETDSDDDDFFEDLNNEEEEDMEIMKVSKENFEKEVLQSDKKVLIDFYADWCGPCKMMAPVVEEIAEELAGKIKVGKVNVDENQDLAMQYGIMSIPTLVVIENGETVRTLVGFRSKQELLEILD